MNNVVNLYRSSGFACQTVRFIKHVHKAISSSIVNKPIPSADASETFCTTVKCKNKFYDVWT